MSRKKRVIEKQTAVDPTSHARIPPDPKIPTFLQQKCLLLLQ